MWSSRTCSQRLEAISQTRIVLSADAEKRRRSATSTAHTISSWPCNQSYICTCQILEPQAQARDLVEFSAIAADALAESLNLQYASGLRIFFPPESGTTC